MVVLLDVALVTHKELALQTSSERGRDSPEVRERSRKSMMESIDPRDIMLEIPTIVSEGSCAGLDGW